MEITLNQSDVTEDMASLEVGENINLKTASFTKQPDGTILHRYWGGPPTTG